MCGRYGFSKIRWSESKNDWYIDNPFADIGARFNVAPSQQVPVITSSGGKHTLEIMRWGLVPARARDLKFAPINARSESIHVKPTFSQLLNGKRCIVPASFFFEWRETSEGKVPYLVRMKDGSNFTFAGLFDSNSVVSGKIIRSFTIITTTPNGLLEPIHNRMPVILTKEAEKIWLDENILDWDTLKEVLNPFPSELLEAYPVSSLVNKPENDFKEILIPLRS